ncbi:MAG: hypothetical protein J6X50_00940 [Bacilli bacterium]|nr:hypothetical protein [Bacilli bacterium]
MKKIFPLLLTTLALSACSIGGSQSQNNNTSQGQAGGADVFYNPEMFSIVTPTGAPALAFYNYAGYKNFETNSVPTNIVAMMNKGEKDVVVLPTNAGVQAIMNANADYKISATITFGNFYIVSMNNDDNQVMDANDTILLFQKNNVPDKIFHYIYGDTLNSALHYVSAVNDAASAIIGGKFTDADLGEDLVPNYVMIAEPALTNVLSKKGDAISVYANVQEEYKKKSNNAELFQASVFTKSSLEYEKVKLFLNDLKGDIEDAIADPSKMSAGMSKIEDAATVYGVAPQMAENVLRKNNGMGLGFKLAKDNKEAIKTFLGIFGINNVDEKIYY